MTSTPTRLPSQPVDLHVHLPRSRSLSMMMKSLLSPHRSSFSTVSLGADIGLQMLPNPSSEHRGEIRVDGRKAFFQAYQLAAVEPVEDRYCTEITLNTASTSDADGSPNSALPDDDGFFAVFDGHNGAKCAEFLHKHMPAAFRRCVQKCGGDLAEGLSAAFKLMDEKWTELVRPQFLAGDVDLAMMGSCSLVCIVRQGKLVVANAGDSRAAVVRVNAFGQMELRRLSDDHNTDSAEELEALREAKLNQDDQPLGSHPAKKRVKGYLRVTRAVGDLYLKDAVFNGPPLPAFIRVKEPYCPPYIHCNPDVREYELSESDRFVLLASDGLWECCSDEEVTEVLQAAIMSIDQNRFRQIPAMLAQLALSKQAKGKNRSVEEMLHMKPGPDRRKLHDDLTIIMVYLPFDATMSMGYENSSHGSSLSQTLMRAMSGPVSDGDNNDSQSLLRGRSPRRVSFVPASVSPPSQRASLLSGIRGAQRATKETSSHTDLSPPPKKMNIFKTF